MNNGWYAPGSATYWCVTQAHYWPFLCWASSSLKWRWQKSLPHRVAWGMKEFLHMGRLEQSLTQNRKNKRPTSSTWIFLGVLFYTGLPWSPQADGDPSSGLFFALESHCLVLIYVFPFPEMMWPQKLAQCLAGSRCQMYISWKFEWINIEYKRVGLDDFIIHFRFTFLWFHDSALWF